MSSAQVTKSNYLKQVSEVNAQNMCLLELFICDFVTFDDYLIAQIMSQIKQAILITYTIYSRRVGKGKSRDSTTMNCRTIFHFPRFAIVLFILIVLFQDKTSWRKQYLFSYNFLVGYKVSCIYRIFNYHPRSNKIIYIYIF